MIELHGKYSSAKVFTDNLEQGTEAQIINLLNQEFISGSKIRIMPDAHAGAGCTIGTTMTITDKVVPNLVGVDIGCGMETVELRDEHIELPQLDKAIHRIIPSGFDIRKSPHRYMNEINLNDLRCATHVNLERAKHSMGTLGGGNHFIELARGGGWAESSGSGGINQNKDSISGKLYLIVHTGSRHLGLQVAEYYQKAAAHDLKRKLNDTSELIADLKRQGRESEIQTQLKKLKIRQVDRNLAYCEGALFDDYLHDMSIIQRYADWNRRAIVRDIVNELNLKISDTFSTIHNYIDLDSMILRKGAISATSGERALIPMNMRDGSLICIGRGNPDWNNSAPHGAGRLMSRTAAKQTITLTQFEKSMVGIYSSTVNKNTIDEAPFAYKPMDEIIANIGETAQITALLKPMYNFKAVE